MLPAATAMAPVPPTCRGGDGVLARSADQAPPALRDPSAPARAVRRPRRAIRVVMPYLEYRPASSTASNAPRAATLGSSSCLACDITPHPLSDWEQLVRAGEPVPHPARIK